MELSAEMLLVLAGWILLDQTSEAAATGECIRLYALTYVRSMPECGAETVERCGFGGKSEAKGSVNSLNLPR